MDFSSSSTSHMPRSIFPDLPDSRRISTLSLTHSDVSASARPANARRHTTYLPARREARPLRSSPLAGPSLALVQDGAITEAGNSQSGQRPALAHAKSSPDISTKAIVTETVVQSPTDIPSSRTSSFDGGHGLSAPVAHSRDEELGDRSASSMSSRLRRLSLKLKRRSSVALSSQSELDESEDLPSVPQARTSSGSSSFEKSAQDAPPVPDIPLWARDSRKMPATNSPSPVEDRKSGYARRSSTTPSSPLPDQSWKQRSTTPASLQPVSPTSLQNVAMPSTSRNPEENWLTSASAPRFSRLSLKREGVVLPISVKEARRRSTVSLSSRSSVDGSIKGKQSMKSLRTVSNPNSETAKRMEGEGEIQPPRPPFRTEFNGSCSSIASSVAGSTAETESITTESRPTSRFSTITDGGLPGAHSPYATELKSSSTLELRINDVTVDVIALKADEPEVMDQSPAEPERLSPSIPDDTRTKEIESTDLASVAKVRRRGTLKKVWKRVVKTVKG